jgi:hypothetical protein
MWKPPRWKASIVSETGLVIGSLFRAQLVCQTGIGKDAAGLNGALVIDKQAARQHAERTLQNAHALIGYEAVNSGIL